MNMHVHHPKCSDIQASIGNNSSTSNGILMKPRMHHHTSYIGLLSIRFIKFFPLLAYLRKPWRDIFTYYLSLITYYLLLITYHLSLITYYLLLITYYLLLTTYHLLLTTYYLLYTERNF